MKKFFGKLLKILRPLWFLITFSGTVLYSGSIDICPESSGDWIKWVPGQFYGGTWQLTTEKTLCNEMTKEPSGWTEWSQWSSESFNISFQFIKFKPFEKIEKFASTEKQKFILLNSIIVVLIKTVPKQNLAQNYDNVEELKIAKEIMRSTKNVRETVWDYEKCVAIK